MREMVAAALMVIMIAGALLLFRSKSSTPSGFARYTQLTNVDSAIDPAISPDGRMLAFVRGTSTGVQAVGDPTELCQAPPGWRSSTAHA
jgi:hypothetical protein